MKRIVAKHPLAIRWCHWLNAPLLALMIWSGLRIYWAYGIYRIGLGSLTLVHFFPEWVYTLFNLRGRLADGMALHFTVMWLFAFNGAVYVTYLAVSGEWRELLPDRASAGEALDVVRHDLGLSHRPLPARKFNGAQRFAYTGIVLAGAASLLTGLAIYKPTQLAWLVALMGGYRAARFLHFWLTMGYLAFFVVHVIQVARAGWNNLRAMITGHELVDVPAPEPPPVATIEEPADEPIGEPTEEEQPA
jgi:thiosulfate reductase cytochrome b subunit